MHASSTHSKQRADLLGGGDHRGGDPAPFWRRCAGAGTAAVDGISYRAGPASPPRVAAPARRCGTRTSGRRRQNCRERQTNRAAAGARARGDAANGRHRGGGGRRPSAGLVPDDGVKRACAPRRPPADHRRARIRGRLTHAWRADSAMDSRLPLLWRTGTAQHWRARSFDCSVEQLELSSDGRFLRRTGKARDSSEHRGHGEKGVQLSRAGREAAPA